MLEIYNNKKSFQNLKPKNLWLLALLIFITILSLIIISIKVKTYDNYLVKGYVKCNEICYVITLVPTSLDIENLKINNKKVNYEILNSEIKLDEENMISYNEITLKPNIKLQDKEILNLNFYYHKQRIITKIKNKIF